jgi:hypothetical protein
MQVICLHVLDSLKIVGAARFDLGGDDFVLLQELTVPEGEGVDVLASVLFLRGKALLEVFELGGETEFEAQFAC